MKLGEGNVFIGVCRSFSPWGWVSLVLCSFRGRYVGVGYVRVWVCLGVGLGMSRVGMSRWVEVCLPPDMRPQEVGMSGSCYVQWVREYVQRVSMSRGRVLPPRHGISGVGMSREDPSPPQGYGRQAGSTDPTGMLFLLQELSANYLLLNSMILHAPSLILLPLFGSLSHKTGRKLLVMISLTGSSLGSLLYLVGSFHI